MGVVLERLVSTAEAEDENEDDWRWAHLDPASAGAYPMDLATGGVALPACVSDDVDAEESRGHQKWFDNRIIVITVLPNDNGDYEYDYESG
jgi:hypothetical protein